MSTAVSSSATPTVVRSHSSSHPHSYRPPSSDLPHRNRSNAVRPPSTSYNNPHHHHSSRSQSYDRRPSSNSAALATVGRRDFEPASVVRPATSRRATSRDRSRERPPPSYRDSVRTHHRTASRHQREGVDMATMTTVEGVAPSTQPSLGSQSIIASATHSRRRTMITTSTGQWSLGETIGAGSMGKVKFARNMKTGEQVAVKIIARQSPDDHRGGRDAERADRSREIRTAREAAIVSLVDHPYICGMRDVVRTNFHWYMLFEYVYGGQMLDYIISHGKLKEKPARKFARQIASALDYCHRNSIVHRDLKIENILINKNGDIKIIDFGLSNLFAPRSYLKTFCGSLYFAAPELLQARQYIGPEVDVWSFGIVLYVLVCGKVPFDDQSMPKLHAKIKRGHVEFPPGLSPGCENIIKRMLVTDPKQRATLAEIMSHPWMTKGCTGPPENHLPQREPLQLPLDPEVIERMTGFDFGTPEYITAQLTRIIESEDYHLAVKMHTQEQSTPHITSEKKRGVFDFYKRRNSSSRDNLSAPSTEAVQLGSDPLNAYSPLISVYYLVKEKLDRERATANPGALTIRISGDAALKIPDLQAPEAAHTNQYELPGENDIGGRSRPRARTHGEDEIAPNVKNAVAPSTVVTPQPDTPVKKESTAAGILRRLSTRRIKDRGRDIDREKISSPQGPTLNVHPPADTTPPPTRTFGMRRIRRAEPSPTTIHPSGSQPQHQDLLAAPGSEPGSRSTKLLERSTSVNSADYRSRRNSRRGGSDVGNDPPLTGGSDHDSISGQKARSNDPTATTALQDAKLAPRTSAMRTKSLGHARRESIQARRARREETKGAVVPETTDVEPSGPGAPFENTSGGEDFSKPVYLKGLFSVSTTSSKPLHVIRTDIIRVLKQLGVEYDEIKGGFRCRHAPSIDLDRVVDAGPPSPDRQGQVSNHRRRISFGGLRNHDREDSREETRAAHLSRTQRKIHGPPDRSFISNSEGSEEYVSPRDNHGERIVGETTTRVQSDTGENLVLRFEIFIVKVPLFSLHGIQFKKVSGGMMQYREMAKRILDGLRL